MKAPQPPSDLPAPSADRLPGEDKLLRALLSLPELTLRLHWLNNQITGAQVESFAPALNRLAERAQSTDAKAREGLFAIAIFLVQKRDTALIWALRQAARKQALLSLERLLREGPEQTDIGVAIDVRIPDYGTGRELTVGERRSLARRPSRLQIERLISDPHPLVVERLLGCPSLTENDVVLIATKRPARLVALELLGQSPRWLSRQRVRMSLILNPATPHGIALPLVSTCRRDDLKIIVTTTTISAPIRSVAHELGCRLPPLDAHGSSDQH